MNTLVTSTGFGGHAGDYLPTTLANFNYSLALSTLTFSSSSTGTYGGTTTAAATLTSNSLPVGNETIAFSLNGVTVGSAVTNASGIAALSSISLAGLHAGTYTGYLAASFSGDATYAAASAVTAVTVNQAPLTVTPDNKSRSYGSANPTLTVTYAGFVNGDTAASLTTPPVVLTTATTASKVGTFPITASGAVDPDYTISYVAGTLTVAPLALTCTVTVGNKPYDGTTSATISNLSLSGVVGTDQVSVTGGAAAFINKHAGTGKTVNVTGLALTGADAGNYTLSSTATATANVTPLPISVTAAPNNKLYDGTTSAAAIPTVTSGSVMPGDTANFIEAYASRNAGILETLTPSGSVNDGNGGNDYTVTFVAAGTGSISARPITVTAVANTKTYDRTMSAATAPTVTSGNIVSGDTAAFVETYDTKNVGTSKTLTPSGAVSDGNSGNNYSVTFVAAAAGTINTRSLIVTATGQNRAYDGTTAAPVTLADNRVSGDVLTTSYASASFADKNAGTGKTVSVSGISITGADAGNYSANAAATTTAGITARPVTVTAAANSKVYDGTTTAAATPTITSGSLVAGDTGSFTESYDTKNAGAGKTLTPTGSIGDGNGGNNYSVTFATSAAGTITPRLLSVTATAQSKVYDGTTTATVTFTDNRLVGDSLTVTASTAAFSDKNVGTGKTVTISGISLSGADAGNYTPPSGTFTGTANITLQFITVTATTNTKAYRGNTTAAAVPIVTAGTIVSGDTANFFETYDNKNAGTGKTLIPSGSVSDGNGGNDYSVTFVNNTTGVITPKAITVTAAANTKTYDGTTAASATPRRHRHHLGRHARVHRDLRHPQRGHGQDAHPVGNRQRRQRRKRLHRHVCHKHCRRHQRQNAHRYGRQQDVPLRRRFACPDRQLLGFCRGR